MKLSSIKIDEKLERGGVWVRWLEDVDLLIASSNSKAYRDEVREQYRRNRSKLSRKNLTEEDEDLRNQIIMRAAARHLLLDWRNIEDDEGNAIPYSPDVGFEFFRDESLRMLFSFVVEFAQEDANFIAEEMEADRGNSSTGSDGG